MTDTYLLPASNGNPCTCEVTYTHSVAMHDSEIRKNTSGVNIRGKALELAVRDRDIDCESGTQGTLEAAKRFEHYILTGEIPPVGSSSTT